MTTQAEIETLWESRQNARTLGIDSGGFTLLPGGGLGLTITPSAQDGAEQRGAGLISPEVGQPVAPSGPDGGMPAVEAPPTPEELQAASQPALMRPQQRVSDPNRPTPEARGIGDLVEELAKFPARANADIVNTLMAVSQGVTGQIGDAPAITDPAVTSVLMDDSLTLEDRMRAVDAWARQTGQQVVYRRSPTSGRLEAVARSPEMTPPGGDVGRILDGVGRMLGLGMADPLVGVAGAGARAGQAVRAGRVGDGSVVATGVGPVADEAAAAAKVKPQEVAPPRGQEASR